MEGNPHLLQVIRKMRSQINKLERENRALRGELQVCEQRAGPPERGTPRGGGSSNVRSLSDGGEGPPGSPAALRGSILPGPAPEPKEQTDSTMTVRRYSTTSPASPSPSTRSPWAGKRPLSNELLDLPGKAQAAAPPAAAQLTRGEEQGFERTLASSQPYRHSSKVKLFREHVSKCRGRVKAVSFLLPAEMSSCAEEPSPLQSPGNQSTKQFTTITGKDM